MRQAIPLTFIAALPSPLSVIVRRLWEYANDLLRFHMDHQQSRELQADPDAWEPGEMQERRRQLEVSQDPSRRIAGVMGVPTPGGGASPQSVSLPII
jgi:hypothetical protein